jgi:hypothetical protein
MTIRTSKHEKLEPETHNFLQPLPEHLQEQVDEILNPHCSSSDYKML